MQPFPSGAYKTSQSVTGEPSLSLQMLQIETFGRIPTLYLNL